MFKTIIERIRNWANPPPIGASRVAIRVYVDGSLLYRNERYILMKDEATPYATANSMANFQLHSILKRLKRERADASPYVRTRKWGHLPKEHKR